MVVWWTVLRGRAWGAEGYKDDGGASDRMAKLRGKLGKSGRGVKLGVAIRVCMSGSYRVNS